MGGTLGMGVAGDGGNPGHGAVRGRCCPGRGDLPGWGSASAGGVSHRPPCPALPHPGAPQPCPTPGMPAVPHGASSGPRLAPPGSLGCPPPPLARSPGSLLPCRAGGGGSELRAASSGPAVNVAAVPQSYVTGGAAPGRTGPPGPLRSAPVAAASRTHIPPATGDSPGWGPDCATPCKPLLPVGPRLCPPPRTGTRLSRLLPRAGTPPRQPDTPLCHPLLLPEPPLCHRRGLPGCG